jgi:prephenate dehydrogenase
VIKLQKVVVVGVGLIGGSCALALKRANAVREVVGVGRTRANLDTAIDREVIDRALTLDEPWAVEVRDADIVLVAAPVAQFPSLFAQIAGNLGPRTRVTDAGSTKQDVVAAAREAFGARIAAFVPGHPIAGTEHSGAAAAFSSLFDNRSVILAPLPETDPDAVARVTAMWQACGARVSKLAPDRHDAIFAAVSHLPHVLAFTLVAELAARPDAGAYFDNAAGGFRDFTRIAASSPEMWRDIALANRDALLGEIDIYADALAAARALVSAGDGDAIVELFEQASQARRAWEKRRNERDAERSEEGPKAASSSD